MPSQIEKLIQEYDSAFEDWSPNSKLLAELQQEAQAFVIRNIRMGQRPDPQLDVYGKLESMRKFFAPGSAPAVELADISFRLNSAREKCKASGARLQEATDALQPEVEFREEKQKEELLSRRSAMVGEITTFLTPYCETVGEARDIAQQCYRVRQLDFAVTVRTYDNDLGRRARAVQGREK